MSPNIFTCSDEWLKKLMKEQDKLVITTWSEKSGEKLNKFLERLQSLESEEKTPIFVIDCDSCGSTASSLGIKEPGETVVFRNGAEVGRLMPGDDFEGDLSKVKEMTK